MSQIYQSVQQKLALKVPPVAILSILAVLAWYCSSIFPFFALNINSRIGFSSIFAILGGVIVFAGAWSCYQAKTTVNPMKPEDTTVLVTTGVFRFSRNPIYLGLTLILCGWGIYLSNLLSVLFVIAFVAYMQHFQIYPEERILHNLFGDRFADYKKRVRRWF